jgi:hypothetical protein
VGSRTRDLVFEGNGLG